MLGIQKGASEDEIKSAYRQKAKKFHPDVFSTASDSEKKNAEEQFKKINHAYQILSDPQKRAAYDQYGDENGPSFRSGSNGGGAGGFGGFGGFDDIFSNIFSSFSGGGRQRNAFAPRRGDDITVNVVVDFMESYFGVEKEIKITRSENCKDCNGTGAKGGTAFSTCKRCGGKGTVTFKQNTMFGQIMQEAVCPDCKGKGRIITDTCKTCGGKGNTRNMRVMNVKIPAGIDNGQTITYSNEGESGDNGGPNGNVVVIISVKPHPLYKRRGNDIYFEVPISFSKAALGGEIDIPTPTGKMTYKLPEETQTGTVFRVKNKGFKYINKELYGDILFTLIVQTPQKLSKSQREILEKLESSMGNNQDEKARKFKEYLK
ncbi:MAG: molecular chaperone DnaJ [Clostridia bacterium]|nr:molecular chaperone DnaJ [Clostridia bacterium]